MKRTDPAEALADKLLTNQGDKMQAIIDAYRADGLGRATLIATIRKHFPTEKPLTSKQRRAIRASYINRIGLKKPPKRRKKT